MENWFRFRILPLTVAMCSLLIVVKLTAILNGEEHIEDVLAASAIAQEAPAEKQAEKPEVKKTAKAEKAADPIKKSDKKSSQKSDKNLDKKLEDKTEKPVEKTTPEELAEKCKFNQIEVDLLESLSARREEIEKWSEDVKMQETVLKATEMQIDQKMTQMQSLKTDVQALLKTYDSKEGMELKSLVKIYENMKPKDAARIFDEMEMGILLSVVDLMSERKAAPILASMLPVKAKDLTVELAEKRKLKNKAMEAAEAAAAEQTPAQP